MNLRICGPLAITAFALSCFPGSAPSLAQNAYITNADSNTVSVVNAPCAKRRPLCRRRSRYFDWPVHRRELGAPRIQRQLLQL
jgi:hypothetical protein